MLKMPTSRPCNVLLSKVFLALLDLISFSFFLIHNTLFSFNFVFVIYYFSHFCGFLGYGIAIKGYYTDSNNANFVMPLVAI